MQTYGVGVLGCGSVWTKYHRHAFERSTRIRLARVYDPIPERAREVAAAFGTAAAGSAEEVCGAPDVDIVAVLSPAFTHAELVEASCAAGKHLMLEKPIANTLADGERIAQAIRSAGVRCFHPTLRTLGADLYDTLKSLVAADGPLGPIRSGYFHLIGAPFAWAPWFEDRTKCVPAAEYGSHVFDMFLTLTGSGPRSVRCYSGRHCREFDQDDTTTIEAVFTGNLHFQMSICWGAAKEWGFALQDFHFICARGVITHSWWGAEWRGADASGSYRSRYRETGGNREGHYEALIDAIEGGRADFPTEEHGLAYLRILEAARVSAETGRPVELSA